MSLRRPPPPTPRPQAPVDPAIRRIVEALARDEAHRDYLAYREAQEREGADDRR